MTLINLKISWSTDLYQQSHRTNWKTSIIRSYRKPLELNKAQDPASCRVLSPIVWHKIHWYPLKVEKSVFQTNDMKELKTQGPECQGPASLTLIVKTCFKTVKKDQVEVELSLVFSCTSEQMRNVKQTEPINQVDLRVKLGKICKVGLHYSSAPINQ